MNNDPRSLPYDTADYLETPADIAEHLEAVIEDCDERAFTSALQTAVRAAKRIMPVEMAEFPDGTDDSSFFKLVSLVRILGFEICFRPKGDNLDRP